MAEAGIKISQLKEVNAELDDFTVLVQDGITRKTQISSIANLATGGTTAGVNEIRHDLRTLSVYTHSLYTNETIDGKISAVNGTISNVQSNIAAMENRLTSQMDNLNRKVDGLAQSLDELSDLTDDPELLSSLTSVIALLSGEDGQASLSNIADDVLKISSDLDQTKKELTPAVKQLEIAADGLLKDEIDSSKFSYENNSLVAVSYNESYDFSYDKNRFANIAGANDRIIEAMLSGIVAESAGTQLCIVLSENDSIPSIDDLEANYYETMTFGGRTLSNVSMVSSIQEEINDEQISSISSWYVLETDNPPEIVVSTSSVASIPFPGHDTFSLNMIPIRSGMFANNEDGTLTLRMRLSGNSDVAIYYANGSEIVDGHDCKAHILTNGEEIAKRRSESDVLANDTDLDLITEKRIKGGSYIELAIDGENLDDGDPSDNGHNLIAAIYAKRLPSDMKDLEVELVSALNDKDSTGHVTGIEIAYRLHGGVTGDQYALSVAYTTINDSSLRWAQWTNGVVPNPVVDTTLLNIEPVIADNVLLSEIIPTEVNDGCELYLAAFKLDNTSTPIQSISAISNGIPYSINN